MISLTEKRPLIRLSVVLFICALIFQSCRKLDSHYVVTNNYPTGEVLSKISYLAKDSLKDGVYREFYKNGKSKKVIFFKRGVPVDSAMQYFSSGELEFKEIRNLDTLKTYHYYKSGATALIKNFLNRKEPIEIGWSVFYNKNGSVTDSVEHIIAEGKSHLNQRINYKDGGQLVIDSCNFYKFSLNSIPNSDLFDLKIKYTPLYEDAYVFIVLGENLNEEFSNINEVKLDTIFMANNLIKSQEITRPIRHLKGFFYEYQETQPKEANSNNASIRIREKKTFFYDTVSVKNSFNGKFK